MSSKSKYSNISNFLQIFLITFTNITTPSPYFHVLKTNINKHSKSIDGIDYTFPEEATNVARTFGGDEILRKDFPYAVALLDNKKIVFCSSYLLKPNFLLTAAHCIDGNTRYAGYDNDYIYKQFKTMVRIRAGFVHGDYLVRNDAGGRFVEEVRHDIGILITDKPVVPAKTSFPYKLTDAHPQSMSDQIIYIYGFGTTVGSGATGVLRRIILQLEPCTTKRFYLVICGSVPNGTRGCCGGDSGGPAVIGDSVVGIVSLGTARCMPNSFRAPVTIFMSVFSYEPWITQAMEVGQLQHMSLKSSDNSAALIFTCYFSWMCMISGVIVAIFL